MLLLPRGWSLLRGSATPCWRRRAPRAWRCAGVALVAPLLGWVLCLAPKCWPLFVSGSLSFTRLPARLPACLPVCPPAYPTACLQDAKTLLAQQRELQFALQEVQEEAAAAKAAAHENKVPARACLPACWCAVLCCAVQAGLQAGCPAEPVGCGAAPMLGAAPCCPPPHEYFHMPHDCSPPGCLPAEWPACC
jgi:hypothetical protein